MTTLNKTFSIFGSLGQIDTKAFPIPPTSPQGFEWENGGLVQSIPTEDYIPDTLNDAVMTSTNAYHEETLLQNITNDGYDYSQEPAWVVYDEETGKFIGKTGRTRAKVFETIGEPVYPVRIMRYIDGYNENTASFNAAVRADISHRPSRSPTWTALSDILVNLKIENVPWYEGQEQKENGEYIYDEDAFNHWYFTVSRLDIRYDISISVKMWRRIVATGISTKHKVDLFTRQQIVDELTDKANGGKDPNPLYDESDGYEVSLVCMDDATANAPAKLRSILKFQSGNSGRYILYTKRCGTDAEIISLRESYAAALRRTVKEYAQFFLRNEVPEKYYEETVDQKVGSFFDNFELYSYNYMKDVEEDLVKIAI